MQIIVNSCCLTVPVNSTTVHTSNRETPTELHQGRVVLNYSPRRPSSVIRHPEVAVREILTKLVQLMKGKFLSSTNIKTICFLETFMNYRTSHTLITLICIITARQRSCRKECFQPCLSVCSGPFALLTKQGDPSSQTCLNLFKLGPHHTGGPPPQHVLTFLLCSPYACQQAGGCDSTEVPSCSNSVLLHFCRFCRS